MRGWTGAGLLITAFALFGAQEPQQPPPAVPTGPAVLIEIVGAIGPATSLHFEKAMEKAEAMNAAIVLLRLDTPGGLDQATRDIIQGILASQIPVVGFVAPSGARAASAGTYILYACHVAAMAPATTTGAATPVQIMPPTPGRSPPGEKQEPASKSPGADSAMERKMVNDSVAYLKGLAEKRGRNSEWAEKAVRQGASVTAEEAVKLKVIDLVSQDVPTLMTQLDGRKVEMPHGTVTLKTRLLPVETIEPSWRLRLLAVLTNPAIAYVLLLLGIYGLLLEGYNPGAILPGVVGAICLLLALYAFQLLPINYAGLGLILLGVILIVAEAFVPSLGVLGIGGVAAFVVGSIMLMDTEVPGYQLPLAIVAAVAAAASALILLIVVMLMRSRRRAITTGGSAMLEERAEALADFDREGWVRAHGETWRARTAGPVRQGQRLRITQVDGLVLTVEPSGEI